MDSRLPFSPSGPDRRARRPRRACSHPRSLLLATALLALPLPAAAVITTLEVTAPSEAVPQATLQIFDVQQPNRIVEERKVESEGTVQVDLESGRSYGVRIKGGPVLVERFEAGDEVSLAIPMAFAKAVLGWTLSSGLGFGWDGRGAKAEIDYGVSPIMPADNDKHIGDGAATGELEVMAPPWELLPDSPRAFFYIAIVGISADKTVVSDTVENNLPPTEIPPDPPTLGREKVTADLRAKTNENWSAGLGAQFSLHIAGLEVRVKPAVGYGQQHYSLRARLEEAYESGPGLPPLPVVTKSNGNHTVHFVQPRLSIETPVGRKGNVEFSGYVSGGVSIRIGGASKKFHVDGTSCCGAVVSADYDFKPDSVGFDFGAGLRISWSPLFLR
ncbi:MAG: hypothetical protein ACE10G_01160 [Gemmatimonadales bacterium]